ncbi:MAG: hypothetical protein A2539_00870 [Elusimicrobia bacterium RIFOXYD2_FULL_34_15]|nr:MAG: hypothetical protein A2539_00870 [Elusimicrobia bacterium RIFOXYD2_FULL_34_15]
MAKNLSREEVKWLIGILKKIEFFATISLEDVDKIIEHFSLYEYPKGKSIIKESESGIALYIIKSGRCVVFKRRLLFLRKTIAILKEGDVFGEMSLLSNNLTSATVKTLQQTKIFVYLKSDFLQLLSRNRELATEIRYIAEKRNYEISNS